MLGARGPVIVDTVLFEKSAAFNRERIPERSVHARGAGAYGTFTTTKDITKYCKVKINTEERRVKFIYKIIPL